MPQAMSNEKTIETLRKLGADTDYKVAAAVLLQAIVTLTLIPSVDLQLQSLIGIVIIDALCIGLAFLWKLNTSNLQRIILSLSILWWLKIYLVDG